MDILSQVGELFFHRKWSVAQALLTDASKKNVGLQRFYSLIHLSSACRGNGDINLAIQAAENAFHSTEDTDPGPSGWFTLARTLEINDRLKLAISALDRVDPSFNKMVPIMNRRLQAAINIQDLHKRSRVQLVALGQNCIPDEITQRWGLSHLRINGPFGVAATPSDGVTTAIEDNFKLFGLPDAYLVNKSLSGVPVAMLQKYRMVLNHESGEEWVNGNLDRLRRLYAERIENFKNAVASDKVLFIHVRVANSDIERLGRAIGLNVEMKSRRLLVFDLSPSKASIDAQQLGIKVAYPTYPFANSNEWHLMENFNSEQGFGFEMSLMDSILEETDAIERVE